MSERDLVEVKAITTPPAFARLTHLHKMQPFKISKNLQHIFIQDPIYIFHLDPRLHVCLAPLTRSHLAHVRPGLLTVFILQGGVTS